MTMNNNSGVEKMLVDQDDSPSIPPSSTELGNPNAINDMSLRKTTTTVRTKKSENAENSEKPKDVSSIEPKQKKQKVDESFTQNRVLTEDKNKGPGNPRETTPYIPSSQSTRLRGNINKTFIDKVDYNINHTAPYAIHAIYKDPSDHRKRAHQSKLGEILMKINDKADFLVENTGYNKFSIQTNSQNLANRLKANSIFKTNNFDVFIPTSSVIRKGIVKGIDTSIALERFERDVKTDDIKIAKITRFNRRSRRPDGTTEWIPSTTLLIEFVCSFLPSKIKFNYCVYEVTPFIPRVNQCQNCYRYNHVTRFCKGKSRCLRCKDEHRQEDNSCAETNTNPHCINCGGNHWANDMKKCPIFLQQKIINDIKYRNNVNLRVAKNIYNYNQNRDNGNQDEEIFTFSNKFAPLAHEPEDENEPGGTEYLIPSKPKNNNKPKKSAPTYADIFKESLRKVVPKKNGFNLESRKTQSHQDSKKQPLLVQHHPFPHTPNQGQMKKLTQLILSKVSQTPIKPNS